MSEPEKEKSTHHFQAEVTKVLGLVINSLYTKKEVFLRELLSNASDALDKLRFKAITEPSLIEGDQRLAIRIIPDEKKRTLTISDNGVGMSRDALATDLGTVAHSGTRAFLEKLAEAKRADVNLIGQFGVGFYSAYLVADDVEVVSRAAGEKQAHRWTSKGTDTFTVEPAERETQGTSIVLHLKPDADYLNAFRLKGLVERYSDFLDYPIELVTREEAKEDRVEVVNQGKALWQRRPQDVEKSQYDEFYKHLTHDFEPPLAHRHFRVEGTQLFSGLLFVPKRAPFDLFQPEDRHGVRLYVKRVFIMDDCAELLPRWLRFVRGVVDSEDLPLNVSREVLQDSSIVRVIRKQIVKQVLDLFGEIAKDEPAVYADFWKTFGRVLKEGLHFEPDLEERLAPLLRYESSASAELTSLADYKSRMPEGQKAIYYVLAESRALAEKSPHAETLRKRGYEVLFMIDPIDSFAVSALEKFDGVLLVSASSADLKIDKESTDESPTPEASFDDLCARIRAELQDVVSQVRVSDRLTDSPACLVVPEGGVQPYIERLLRASDRAVPRTKRILEINPKHPVVLNLDAVRKKNADTEHLKDWMHLLFEQALLAEGSPIEDPTGFAARLTALLQDASGRAAANG